MTKTNHTPDEFDTPFAATICDQANDALNQWQANVTTFARTALQARRDYITTIRCAHVDGLDGALVPVAEAMTADVTSLYIRQAAPTKERPRQYRVRLLSGELIDVEPHIGGEIYVSANRRNYAGFVVLPGDRPHEAKWCQWRLDGNDLGLLLQKETEDDRYVVAG